MALDYDLLNKVLAKLVSDNEVLSTTCTEQKTQLEKLQVDLDTKVYQYTLLQQQSTTLSERLQNMAKEMGYERDVFLEDALSTDFVEYVQSVYAKRNEFETEIKNEQRKSKGYNKLYQRWKSSSVTHQGDKHILHKNLLKLRRTYSSLRKHDKMLSDQLYLELSGKREDEAAGNDNEVIDLNVSDVVEVFDNSTVLSQKKSFLVFDRIASFKSVAAAGLCSLVFGLGFQVGKYDSDIIHSSRQNDLVDMSVANSRSTVLDSMDGLYLLSDYSYGYMGVNIGVKLETSNPNYFLEIGSLGFQKTSSVLSSFFETFHHFSSHIPEEIIEKKIEASSLKEIPTKVSPKIYTTTCGSLYVKDGFEKPLGWDTYVCRAPVADNNNVCLGRDIYSDGEKAAVNDIVHGCSKKKEMCCPSF